MNEVSMAGGPQNESDPVRSLANALSTLQRNSGRPLRSLESEIHVSDSSLSRYLRGHCVPPWDVVRALCMALGADPAEYRARWEAAEAVQPRTAPEPSSEKPDTAPTRTGRGWLWALAGAGVGTVLGSVITLAFVSTATAPTPTPSGMDGSAGLVSAPGGNRIFVSRATGACLDDSLDGGLRTYRCNGMSYQRWTPQDAGDGTYRLSNHATGACLDLSSTGLRSAACAEIDSQRWKITVSQDAAEVRSTVNDACLHDSSAGLQLAPCDRSRNQQWG
ncbi:ricin-type beta-trefoil lectin domain protein [Lentzea sp. NPDC051208]|uniref:ricin-type beta-trefoil lectin domain protein n=1 Tax=Lentzea sp. NPDC051208 TaxID=3154642 RepID=UPI00342484B5